MKIQKNYLIILFVLVAMLIINCLTALSNIQNTDYVTCGNTVMTKSTLDNVSQIIKSVSTFGTDEALSKLTAESERLQKYRTALEINEKKRSKYRSDGMTLEEAEKLASTSTMTDAQAESKKRIVDLAVERLIYVRDYPEYIRNLQANAESMMSVSIFDSNLKANILNVEKSYYGFENIKISPEQDAGINILFKDRITDILCIVTMFVCAWLYISGFRAAAEGKIIEKSRLSVAALFVSAAVIMMYAENGIIAEKSVGLGDLSRSVQSVWEFISCPYEISAGVFAAVRILFKMTGCLIVFFLSTAFLSSKSRFKWCIVLFPIMTETLLTVFGSKWHVFSIFSSERIIGQYGSYNILGGIFNHTLLLCIVSAAVLIFSFLWAYRTVEGMLLSEKNAAERKYYDEMTEKYNETRMIRHDIKNHLTAVAILIDDGKIDDARKYLDDISSEMDKVRPPVNTGSLVLDSLLFSKSSEMKRKGIKLNTEFFIDFSENQISEYDLCSIFGNILDNAIEATEKISPEERYINLRVKRHLDMICIICENPYNEINEDLSTQKADKAYHGFGLKRVRKAAENYSGDVNINCTDGIFCISVLLNFSSDIKK